MKDLVKIIRDNPGCVAVIDNDGWDLFSKGVWDLRHDCEDLPALASSGDNLKRLKGTTYQDDNCYGGAILLALAEIVGMKVQSV